ncbi:MAG: LysR family transcriptional regulator [Polyangiaceae bacterium]
MKLPLDDLPAMALFAQVVRLRSFSAAAREAGVAKSVVSKRIAALEDKLRVRLLVRTTRKLTPTPEGLSFYEHCAALCASAIAAEESVGAARSDHGTVRINASGAFAAQHLAPAIAAFLARHPGIDVHLSTEEGLVDLADGGADLLVRVSRRLRGSAVVRRIASDRMFVVAAKDYLARAGTPSNPADLVHHNCLRYALMTAAEEWQFHEAGRPLPVPVTGNLVSESAAFLRAAAVAGVGIAMLPGFLIAPDIAEGRVVSLLAPHVDIELGIHVLMPHRTQLPGRVRHLVEFLAQRFAGIDWALPHRG